MHCANQTYLRHSSTFLFLSLASCQSCAVWPLLRSDEWIKCREWFSHCSHCAVCCAMLSCSEWLLFAVVHLYTCTQRCNLFISSYIVLELSAVTSYSSDWCTPVWEEGELKPICEMKQVGARPREHKVTFTEGQYLPSLLTVKGSIALNWCPAEKTCNALSCQNFRNCIWVTLLKNQWS